MASNDHVNIKSMNGEELAHVIIITWHIGGQNRNLSRDGSLPSVFFFYSWLSIKTTFFVKLYVYMGNLYNILVTCIIY